MEEDGPTSDLNLICVTENHQRQHLDVLLPEAFSVSRGNIHGPHDDIDENGKEDNEVRKIRNGAVIVTKSGDEKNLSVQRDRSQSEANSGGDPRASRRPNQRGEDDSDHDPDPTRSNRYPNIQNPIQPNILTHHLQPNILTHLGNQPEPDCLTLVDNLPKPKSQAQPFNQSQTNTQIITNNQPHPFATISFDNNSHLVIKNPRPIPLYSQNPILSSLQSENAHPPLPLELAEEPGVEATSSTQKAIAGTERNRKGELEEDNFLRIHEHSTRKKWKKLARTSNEHGEYKGHPTQKQRQNIQSFSKVFHNDSSIQTVNTVGSKRSLEKADTEEPYDPSQAPSTKKKKSVSGAHQSPAIFNPGGLGYYPASWNMS
ncbi:hypothetical protein U1Q18_016317 [Sarracenia purpurea var. burkii]